MEEVKYLLVKDKKEEKLETDLSKIPGFTFNPQNNIEYEGVTVDSMKLTKPELIEKVLKKKIKRKINLYLQIIIELMESSEDDGTIDIVLNDLERYRRVIMNNYRIYLNEKYVNLLFKKIELLENELKTKQVFLRTNKEVEKKGKARWKKMALAM